MAAGLLLALAACQPAQQAAPAAAVAGGPKVLPTSAPAEGMSGRLVYVKLGGLFSYDLGSRQSTRLVAFPSGAFGGLPAASPDGKLVAYGLYVPSPTRGEYGGTDLYVAGAGGSEPRVVLQHGEPGVSLSEAAWAPDGQQLYFTRRGLDGKTRIERVDLDGSGREVVVENAFAPSISGDGQRLAYLSAEPGAAVPSLWVAGIDGQDPRRLLESEEYQALAFPRFSPDGESIAFSAVKPSTGPSAPGSTGGVTSWLGPEVAHAHGVPWDVWRVGTDGSGLQRLTHLEEDSPIATWSPDGSWIAFAGELGLYVVDPEGKQTRRLSEEGGGGGIAWLP